MPHSSPTSRNCCAAFLQAREYFRAVVRDYLDKAQMEKREREPATIAYRAKQGDALGGKRRGFIMRSRVERQPCRSRQYGRAGRIRRISTRQRERELDPAASLAELRGKIPVPGECTGQAQRRTVSCRSITTQASAERRLLYSARIRASHGARAPLRSRGSTRSANVAKYSA